MDSINRQQTEQTQQDLHAAEAVAKIKEIAEAHTCFFCTRSIISPSNGVRPMAVQKIDDAGHLWFLSADDSNKNGELITDPTVQLLFQGSAHSDFLVIDGTATVSKDRAKIEELWEPIIKNWFTGGVDDPRITVIEVTPTGGYYWDTKHGNFVAGAKMLFGAATGQTFDDSVEGKLTL